RDLVLQADQSAIEAFGLLGTADGQRVEQRGKALRLEDLIHQTIGHEPIEFLHRDGAPSADRLALGRTACAGVVAVYATILGSAGAEHHSAAAGGAHRQTGQKYRTGRYSRRHDSWAAAVQLPLDACENILRDDRGHSDFDDLFVGLSLVRFR